MKIKIKKEVTFKQVINHCAFKQVYVAKNGREFDTELAAVNYEKMVIDFDNFFKRDTVRLSGGTFDTIIVSSLEEPIIFALTEYYKKYLKGLEDLRIGLNLIEVDTSGDYQISYVHNPVAMLLDAEKDAISLKALLAKELENNNKKEKNEKD